MTPEQATQLREPFPAAAIGQLPKPTKADNPKGTCKECGKYHGLPAVHLDYVGHAATTDRLLQVDPEWTWEPMARGDHGEPLMTNGGMWILLTVAGVTKPGFGDGANPKEIISDAIRNAAMRFGVALDLWSKEDLHAEPPKELSKEEQETLDRSIAELEKALYAGVEKLGNDTLTVKLKVNEMRRTEDFPAWLMRQVDKMQASLAAIEQKAA